jgi:hypothetical protein
VIASGPLLACQPRPTRLQSVTLFEPHYTALLRLLHPIPLHSITFGPLDHATELASALVVQWRTLITPRYCGVMRFEQGGTLRSGGAGLAS